MDSTTTLPSGNLRLAAISDIPRLGVVATAGFYYSPAFTWERKHHRQYPGDTIKAFEKTLAEKIRNPEQILVVAQDAYQEDENTKIEATIESSAGEKGRKGGEMVIVGFAAWTFPEGSELIGKFMDEQDGTSDEKPVFDGGLNRDSQLSLKKQLRDAIVGSEKKHFQGRMVLDLVAIHPAYWRRGHGKALLNWGLALAGRDGVKTGVVANSRFVGMYLSMDFVKVGGFEVIDEDEPPNVIAGFALAHD